MTERDHDRDWIESVRELTRPERLSAIERQRLLAELRERAETPRRPWIWVGAGGLASAAAAALLAFQVWVPAVEPDVLPADAAALASWEAELLWPHELGDDAEDGVDDEPWPDDYDAIDELWLAAGPPDERAGGSKGHNPTGRPT